MSCIRDVGDQTPCARVAGILLRGALSVALRESLASVITKRVTISSCVSDWLVEYICNLTCWSLNGSVRSWPIPTARATSPEGVTSSQDGWQWNCGAVSWRWYPSSHARVRCEPPKANSVFQDEPDTGSWKPDWDVLVRPSRGSALTASRCRKSKFKAVN